MTTTVDYALMAGNAYQSTRNPANQIPLPQFDGWAPVEDVQLRHRLVGGFAKSGGGRSGYRERLARRWYAATFIRLPQTLMLHQRRAWFLLRS